MRRFPARALVTLLIAISALSGAVALACGDKLLAIGRGVRFQRIDAAREANLVIYCPGSQGGALLGNAKLQTALRRAVHKLELVQGGPQLDQALKAGRVDLVLVEFDQISGIARELQAAPSRPAILPVLVKPSKSELAAAQKEYRFALKATAGDLEYLAAIDEAKRLRLKAGAKS
jgi:hypothetical protein